MPIENTLRYQTTLKMSHEQHDALCAELNAYCEKHGLPHISADELLHELFARDETEQSAMTDRHIEWVTDFIERWDEWCSFEQFEFKQARDLFGQFAGAMI